ncbi:uncharacterized protein LOC123988348 [Osmia bicornis bicornis]|uniref:uncharacterized protein LOC123988348 n=1 Tax=Osmia bicornis bicornis TaxID=1437191 RepID=UPI001EAF57A5|nr:uncharacterized protein LOC123988348 [Osmia bicornis bicornis]
MLKFKRISVIGLKTPVAVQIMLTADIVENLLKEKDLEIRELQRCLHDAKSNLTVIVRDTDINVNNLKVQLSEKCKKIEEIEQRTAKLQKDSREKQEMLTVEMMKKDEIVSSLRKQVTVLQKQVHCANLQTQCKEGIVKEVRKELKQTVAKLLYSGFLLCYDKITIDSQEMESFCKLYACSDHKNCISFLQSCIKNATEAENIATIEEKVNNLKAKAINYHKSRKYLNDIDKKILKYGKKLPPFTKHVEFQDCKKPVVLETN